MIGWLRARVHLHRWRREIARINHPSQQHVFLVDRMRLPHDWEKEGWA